MKPKYKVMVSAPYLLPVLDRFRRRFERHGIELVVPRVNERLEEEELLPLVPDLDGVICGDDRFSARVLEAAPRLKVIAKWGTGIDSIDQDACRRLGITICNTPGAFSEPVADSVLGYILAFARRLPCMDRHMKQGSWEKIPGHSLGEAVLGVIGVGNVGKAVVRRARAFGMRVLGNDLKEMPPDFIVQTGIEMVDKPSLLAQADYLSLNCDLNPTSYHLLNQETLGLMKPGAVVINTARGPLVDEPALVRALRKGRLAGAALDVFEEEPLPPDSPLLGMDNVMLAPHNANSSPRAWERVHQSTIDQLLAALEAARP